MTLGENIKAVRTQKKMSQSELARLADVHQKNISKYENDGVVPSALTIKAIAEALGVTTDYLLGSEKEDLIGDSNLLRQFKEVDKMPDKMKEALSYILDSCIRDFKAKQAYAE